MATATRAVAPKTRKGRTATVRPSIDYINSNIKRDNTVQLRLQRLRLLGIIGWRAQLLADLAWGEVA